MGDGVLHIPDILLPTRPDVHYTVSVQYGIREQAPSIPTILLTRPDVTVTTLTGVGLSANRNNAIRHAKGDICLIADDDNRYLPEHIETILAAWRENPQADILTFQAQTYNGELLHPYPATYVCSVEITFRRNSILSNNLFFDERFGLGSPLLCAGEEEIFITDARRLSLSIKFIPSPIVQTNGITTSYQFIGNTKLQITKGATFRYIYGTWGAIWRSIKEAGWYLIHKRANPLPILFNMIHGIWILR